MDIIDNHIISYILIFKNTHFVGMTELELRFHTLNNQYFISIFSE